MSLDIQDILEEKRKEKIEELTPVLVIVCFLLIFGLIGNCSVLLFFWRRVNDSVANIFIVMLAVVDTLVCLTIALIIMDLTLAYKYPSNAGCKIHSFCKFFTAIFSAFLLLTIAIHRYRMICCPFKKQLTLRTAKIAVIFCMCISILLSIPILFVYEMKEVQIANNYNVTVVGYSCASTRDKELQKLQTGMNYIFFLLFIATSIILIVLYSLQARTISRLKKNRATFSFRYETNESCSSTVTREEIHDRTTNYNINESTPTSVSSTTTAPTTRPNDYIHEHETETGKPDNKEYTPASVPKKQRHSLGQNEKQSKEQVSASKISIIFCIITAGFILSFCPYIVYALQRNFATRKRESFSGATVENQLLTNSYLINSVINPIIYGIIHSEFKQFLRQSLCCWRKKARLSFWKEL